MINPGSDTGIQEKPKYRTKKKKDPRRGEEGGCWLKRRAVTARLRKYI